MNEATISPLQAKVLAIPEEYDVFLGGGRGGAKSYAKALLAVRHIEMYGPKARVLYIRQTYKGIADFENICRDVFFNAYGQGARYNASEHVWRFPNGAMMELGQLEGPADYLKYQGRSFTLLLVDEAGHYATPELLDRLRSNLRGPKDVPVRVVMAANPGDPGHYWLAQRYVFKAKPWMPFYEERSKREWIYAPSTFLDNPFINQEEYKAQLEASCPTDPELLRAWLEGDWAIARGAFFASVIEEKRNAVDPWKPAPGLVNVGWKFYLAHDYGSSAPSVTYIVAKSPGATGPDGRYYPRDSLVLVEEFASNAPGQLNQGMGYTIPTLAERIKEMCKPWRVKPSGVADDAIFAKHGHEGGSAADEFKRQGVYFYPAKKGSRKGGWEKMRRLLQDAGKLDVPGLYISRNCEYFWATVPYLARDPKDAEDLDSRGPDHAADCARYGCLHEFRTIVVEQLHGT